VEELATSQTILFQPEAALPFGILLGFRLYIDIADQLSLE
jgi:hypothetical protein